MRTKNNRRRGFTLVEMLVVLSILILLSGLAIVKLSDVYDRSRSSTQAYSLADVNRQIEIYYGLNHKYPEGWDILLKSNGPALAPGPQLYSKLSADVVSLLSPTPVTLTADQLTSLSKSGISHHFANISTGVVSDSGAERHHFGAQVLGHDGTMNSDQVVVIDSTTVTVTDWGKGLKLLINDFGLNANAVDAPPAIPTRITQNIYVVFGLGKKSNLVQNQIQEAPMLETPNGAGTYSRALAVFEVSNLPGNTTRAKLVGMIGPDGRSRAVSASDYATGVVQH